MEQSIEYKCEMEERPVVTLKKYEINCTCIDISGPKDIHGVLRYAHMSAADPPKYVFECRHCGCWRGFLKENLIDRAKEQKIFLTLQ